MFSMTFLCLTKSSCFISPYWQEKTDQKYVSGKTKLGEKMNDFSKQLAHASRPTMESVIENSEKCQRSVSKLLSKFEDMGVSSVPTSDKNAVFTIAEHYFGVFSAE